MRFQLHYIEDEDPKEWLLNKSETYPESLFEKFDVIELDERPWLRIICRNCGIGAWVEVTWFECRQKFVVTKAICRYGCGKNRWKLQIKAEKPKGLREH